MPPEVRVIGHGRHATVFATRTGSEQWSARKVVSAPRNGRSAGSQPHDAVKEVNILNELDHPNIISLESYDYDEQLLEHHLQLPLLPFSLRDLLDNRGSVDGHILKSVAFQTLLGLAHVHRRSIAHRDIKPANIMFDWDGTVKLIDFGTAWAGGDKGDNEEMDLPWRETSEDMCCSVGSGHYRAPELLFSPTTYDPLAIDIWALGVVIADCLGPPIDAYDDDCPDDGSESSHDPLNDGSESSARSHVDAPTRKLYDDTYGDVGLAASIFRIMGSPNEETWPGFRSLPDAGKIEFVGCPPRPLVDYYPDAEALLLDLIFHLLQLEPERRLSAENALRHTYFDEVLVPSLHDVWFGDEPRVDLSSPCVELRDGKQLVDLLEPEMGTARANWDLL